MNQLSAIQKQLADVDQELAGISAQLTVLQAEVAKGTYSGLKATFGLGWVGTSTDFILQDLEYLADHLAECTAAQAAACLSPIPDGVDVESWCTSAGVSRTPVQGTSCDLLEQLREHARSDEVANAPTRLLGNAGADGLITAYERALTAHQATSSGFVTAGYAASTQTIIDHYSLVAALVASYSTQYAAVLGLPAELLDRRAASAQATLDALAQLQPRPLPANTVIDPRTGLMWALIPASARTNAACGTTHGPYAVFSPFSRDALGVFPCSAAILAGAPAEVSGWLLPQVDDVQTLVAPRPDGTTLLQWMQDAKAGMGLPDLSGAAAADPVPAPDPKLIRDPKARDWARTVDLLSPNPGTSGGLGTATCAAGTRSVGAVMPIPGRLGPGLPFHGTFCDYVRLDDATVASECVRSQDRPGECATPSVRTTGDDPQMDFGHPLVWMLKRPATEDGYYLPVT